jgi:hypothetical protein
MHKNNFYISFGVWLAILPFLGVPGTWKNNLVFLSGVFLILMSVGPVILKKLQTKPKIKKKQESSKEELKFSDNPLNNENT